jgi:hypothetical protein
MYISSRRSLLPNPFFLFIHTTPLSRKEIFLPSLVIY